MVVGDNLVGYVRIISVLVSVGKFIFLVDEFLVLYVLLFMLFGLMRFFILVLCCKCCFECNDDVFDVFFCK